MTNKIEREKIFMKEQIEVLTSKRKEIVDALISKDEDVRFYDAKLRKLHRSLKAMEKADERDAITRNV